MFVLNFYLMLIFRWRGDAELAAFAWSQPETNPQFAVNMLLTEPRPIQDWSVRRDTNLRLVEPSANVSDSEASSSQQSDDLTLMVSLGNEWKGEAEFDKFPSLGFN